MDGSRDHDLRQLYERFNNRDLPKAVRLRSRRSFDRILAQMRDKGLSELRHRLVKAQHVGDQEVIFKIDRQIQEYSFKKGYALTPPDPYRIELVLA